MIPSLRRVPGGSEIVRGTWGGCRKVTMAGLCEVESMAVSDNLVEVLRNSLSGNESPAQVAEMLRGISIPESEIPPVLRALGLERGTGVVEVQPVRLIVDWGTWPRVGHQARPRMMVICPAPYHGRPTVVVRIDRDLDHDFDPVGLASQLRRDAEGLWSLHVPFRLSTNNTDCRPGQYVLDVEVSFEDLDGSIPRFFETQIRLTIPGQSSSGQRELVIDGDGQSIVDLQGQDLADFSRVVLKGSGQGIINLQPSSGGDPERQRGAAGRSEATTHEYELRFDPVRQARAPRIHDPSRFRRPAEVSRGTMLVDSSRRIQLVSKRQVVFGRNRECDVVLRFLPRSTDHDRNSQNISRRHFALGATADGVLLRDLNSRTGLELDFQPVQGEMLIPASRMGTEMSLSVGTDLEVETPLRLAMTLYGGDQVHRTVSAMTAGRQQYDRATGEQPNSLASVAGLSGIDGCRLRRKNNLVTEEEYFLLFGQALIGTSTQCAIRATGQGIAPVHARILHLGECFWLENLSECGGVVIQGESIPPHRLIPLAPGLVAFVGETSLAWSEFEQVGL